MAYTDKERKRQYNAKYYEAHRDQVMQCVKEYYEAHRDQVRQRNAKYYEANQEQIRQRKKQDRVFLRGYVLSMLGGACARCGCSDKRVLVIDHVHGGGTSDRRTLGASTEQRYMAVLNTPVPEEKYQLLCSCCNHIKAYEEHELSHTSTDRGAIVTKELRLEILYNLGAFCRCCGYNNDIRALQIDHVEGGGGEEKAIKSRHRYYLDILNDLGGGYQILCANCHMLKHRESEPATIDRLEVEE